MAIFAFFLSLPVSTLAQDDMTPCERFGTYAATFVGEAGEPTHHWMKYDPDRAAIRIPVLPLVVEQAFRGVTPGSTVYLSPPNLPTVTVTGRRYLVYGSFNFGDVSDVVTALRLTPVEEATNDLSFLSNRDVLSSTTGRVYGAAVQGSRFAGSPRRPLAGVSVRFRSEDWLTETVTDAEGRYDVPALPEGFVRIEPMLPDRLATWEAGSIEVRAGGCTPHHIIAEWNGRIRGRVLRPDQRPLTGMVDLVPVDPRREDFERDGRSVRANKNGEYEFAGVPPGEYRVGVNLRRPPDAGGPFAATYFAGTTRLEEAAKVSVGEGTEHNGIDFAIPAALKRGQLEVRAAAVAGVGVVSVCLGFGSTGATYRSAAPGEPVHIDVVEGSPYRFWAHVEGSAGSHWESNAVDVVGAPGRRVVTLNATKPGRAHSPGFECGPYATTPSPQSPAPSPSPQVPSPQVPQFLVGSLLTRTSSLPKFAPS